VFATKSIALGSLHINTEHGAMKIAVFDDISREYLTRTIPGARGVSPERNPDVLFVRSTDLKKKKIRLPGSLAAICRIGSGVDNIPIDWCNQNGVVVFNTPSANANAVKELIICLLIASNRNVVPAIRFVEDNIGDKTIIWEQEKKAFKGTEIYGKRILVIGLGNVGALVAGACRGLGLEVFGYDPYIPYDKFPDISRIESLEDERVGSFDFVTLHAGLTPETVHLMGRELLMRMKHGALLINCGRSELVETGALCDAIEAGRIRMYMSDFIYPELARFIPHRVICLPHLGASTKEAEERRLPMAVKQLCAFWERGAIANSVNFPTCNVGAPNYLRLLINHVNIPGVIAQATEVIARTGHNIGFHLNKTKEGVGYSITDIDDPREDISEVIRAIEHIDGVTKVRVVQPGKIGD